MIRTVSILCAHTRTAYNFIPGVEVYDVKRDARTFCGGTSIVAHPPCKAWSVHCRHQAKFEDQSESEMKEVGRYCVEQLRVWGGVLEQPASSLLFSDCGLPIPSMISGFQKSSREWSCEVWQSWWGYPIIKRTWLCFFGISPWHVQFPLRLHRFGRDARIWKNMTGRQRSETTFEFARWLVDQARLAFPGSVSASASGQQIQAVRNNEEQ